MGARNASMGLILCALFYAACALWRFGTHARVRLETDIVTATHDLQVGMMIKAEDIEVDSRPAAPVPGCVLTKAQVIGQTVVIPVAKGAMLCSSEVSPIEEVSFSSPTRRALWLPIHIADAALLKPGVWVDVFATRARGFRAQDQTTALLKHVLVLAVGNETNGNSKGKDLMLPVALLVSPDDAQKLIAASRKARVQLSMTAALGTK